MLEPVSSTHNAASERDVIGQIKLAFANPLPLIIGMLLGALVPIATYTVGHAELAAAGWKSLPGAIVVGGCLFSAITVYKWGRRAFDCTFKAIGFVVLSEGVMTFSQTPWLSMVVLGFLVAINAVANGANLAIAHLDAEARRLAVQGAALSPVVTVQAPVVMVASSTPSVETALVPSTSSVIAGDSAQPEVKLVAAGRRRVSAKAKSAKAARTSRRGPTMLN